MVDLVEMKNPWLIRLKLIIMVVGSLGFGWTGTRRPGDRRPSEGCLFRPDPQVKHGEAGHTSVTSTESGAGIDAHIGMNWTPCKKKSRSSCKYEEGEVEVGHIPSFSSN